MKKIMLFIILLTFLIIPNVYATTVTNDLTSNSTYKSNSKRVKIAKVGQYIQDNYDGSQATINQQIKLGRITGAPPLAIACQGLAITDNHLIISQSMDAYDERYNPNIKNPIMGINKKTLSKSFTKKYSIRHGNDMTYNKKTKEVYIIKRVSRAAYLEDVPGTYLTVHDSSDLTLKRTIDLSDNGGLAIAYNSKKDNYYWALSIKTINILNNSFSKTEDKISNTVGSNFCKVGQTMSVINNKLYYLTVKNKPAICSNSDGYARDDAVIFSFDENGNFYKTYYVLRSDMISEPSSKYLVEFEGIDVDESTGIIYFIANKYTYNKSTDAGDVPTLAILLYKADSAVKIRYKINTKNTTLDTSEVGELSINGDGYVMKKSVSTSPILHTLKYGETLTNTLYNVTSNSSSKKGINLIRKGYKLESGKEWISTSGDKKGTVYDHGKSTYTALSFNGPSLTDTTITLMPNWIPNKINIRYHMNGGTLDPNHGSSISTSNSLITVDGNNIVQSINYGEELGTNGLVNYNNSNYINIKRTGYKVKANAQWNMKADGTGKSFNQIDQYKASEFCDASNGDCTVTLYVNWTPTDYTINYNLNGGTVSGNPTSYNIETNSFTLKNPTKVGYTFTGWTGTGLSTKTKTVTISKGSTGNRTYTANWELNKVNIKFNMNNGTLGTEHGEAISSEGSYITLNNNTIVQKVNYGQSLSTDGLVNYNNENYVNIVRTGYTAKIGEEWNTKNDGTGKSYNQSDQYKASELCDASSESCTLNLFVNWIPVNYTITYNLNGGTASGNKTNYNIETNSFTLTNPTKSGYTFTGWTGTGLSNSSTTVTITKGSTGNRTYIANYSARKYTITFNSNGGSTVNFIEANYGSTITEPANPTKSGFKFAGWYEDEALTSLYTFNKMPNHNVTLYAKWTESENTIRYVLNGGTNNQSNPTTYQTGIEKTLYAPTKAGYIFVGWYLENEYLNKVEKISSDMNTDLTLYAKWESGDYTISFNSNGGSNVDNISKKYGEEVTAPTNPTKEGYIFVGWYSDQELTNQYIFTTMPNQNLTLYAKWRKNTYTIKFETNGGTELEDIDVEYDDIIIKPTDPKKEGYTFDDWYTDNTLTEKYNFDLPVSRNITLYAKWEINNYTISFETDGGNEIPSMTVRYNNSITPPANPQKDGYDFVHWVDDDNEVFTFGNMPGHNITLYAIWEEKEYTISFNSNGGSNVESITAKYQENINEPVDPVKEDYKFAGWYRNSELTELYSFTTMPKQNITLYAKWVKNANVINYELYGGENSENNVTSFTDGEEISLLNPTKKGYIFRGWYLEETYQTRVDRITSDMNEDVSLYAKWEAISYRITYVSNGGSVINSIEKAYDEELTEPEDPIRKGYKFVGWYSDEELTQLYTFSTMPAEDITLYAKWEIGTYRITFVTNGGSTVNDIVAEYGAPVVEPNPPYKENYKFTGWYTDESLNNLYSFTTMPDNDITLYAGWVDNNYNVIRYVLNGGINYPKNPTYYLPGEEKELFSPTKEGYTFLGWYSDPEYQHKVEKISSQMNGDITLYAKWSEGLVFQTPPTGLKTSKIIALILLLVIISSSIFIYRNTTKNISK